MQQTTPEPGTEIDCYSQRKMHPRTGDVGAFNGRTAGHVISPRSAYHDDLLRPSHSLHTQEEVDEPSEAGVELEGCTQDGGLALNVEFDQNLDQDVESTQQQQGSHVHPQHGQQVASTASIQTFLYSAAWQLANVEHVT